MHRLFDLIRGNDWWYSKIPPLLAFAYLNLLLQPLPPLEAYTRLAAFLSWAIGFAAYAHVINDWTDIGEDRRAGKKNRMAPFSRQKRAAILGITIVVSLAPWALVPLDARAWILLAFDYFIPIVYSVPPLRVKERGVLSVLADAGVAHVMPTLLVFAIFASGRNWETVTLGAAGIWALFAGSRNFLLGQMWDVENDTRAGVNTFTRAVGVERVRQWITRFIFPIEVCALLALGISVVAVLPWLLAVILAALFFDVVKCKSLWRIPYNPAPRTGEQYVPPHDLYQVWLPLVCAGALAIQNIGYAPLLVLQIILFYPDMERRKILPAAVACTRLGARRVLRKQ